MKLIALASLGVVSCTQGPALNLPAGDPDNGGLFLPDGFEAVVVADSVGRARHLTVDAKGDIYVKLRVPNSEGQGLVALRDSSNDGKADVIAYFGDYPDTGNYGTAMRVYNGYLYFSTAGEVYRIKMDPDSLVPTGEAELIVRDDYKNATYGYEHIAKPIAFDNEGNLYVPFGSPGDVCQEFNRRPGAPGMDPCPQLEWHGGIWRFDADTPNQTQHEHGYRYATGIRSVVAMEWNQDENTLYVVQHGRDNMNRTWPDMYSPWESAVLPSEEFFRVEEGSDGGWPYYYYDQLQGKKLRNPEYGGDKQIEADPKMIMNPIVGFPGHFAPNDLHFYRGTQFPERYRQGAFVAFHGSTIRGPYPQAGYFVGFVPFKDGKPSGPWEVFADGFAQLDTIVNTGDAAARPMGLSMGPDGSLYITESVKGKIWRVMYKGKGDLSKGALAKLEERKNTRTNIKNPHPENDNLEVGLLEAGAKVYNLYCATCHQRDGKGDGTRFPPLAQTDWVTGNKRKLIEIVLQGMDGPITVNGVNYNQIMPAHNFLSNDDLASALTYIRKSFGNDANSVSAGEVQRVRELLAAEGEN